MRRRPGKRGRGAAGKMVVAGAVEAGRGKGRGRRLGRLQLQAVADASADSLEGFLAANVAKPAEVTTDGWSGYRNPPAKGYDHQPLNRATGPRGSADPRRCANGSTEARWGDASLRLPAIHLVFGLAKRWLLGTRHGAVSK
jgi:ISXO2-like transposase domain